MRDLAQRAPLDRPALEALVVAGACDSFGWPRRQLLWRLGLAPRSVSVGEGGAERQLALPLDPQTEIPELPEETPWERMLADYRDDGLSVDVHPLELLRPHLPEGVLRATSSSSGRTARVSRSPGSSSRASGRRRRTASSSCSSRTSTGR